MLHSWSTSKLMMSYVRPSKNNARQASLSSALVKSRKGFLLFAPPGVTVVLLLLVPETWCCLMTLGDKALLGAEVTLSLILTLENATLVLLEANFLWIKGAMGAGSHGVSVALMSYHLRVVELVEGACGVCVLGDLCSVCHVMVHNIDRRWILVVELAIGE